MLDDDRPNPELLLRETIERRPLVASGAVGEPHASVNLIAASRRLDSAGRPSPGYARRSGRAVPVGRGLTAGPHRM